MSLVQSVDLGIQFNVESNLILVAVFTFLRYSTVVIVLQVHIIITSRQRTHIGNYYVSKGYKSTHISLRTSADMKTLLCISNLCCRMTEPELMLHCSDSPANTPPAGEGTFRAAGAQVNAQPQLADVLEPVIFFRLSA
jgi:hypothetical protein